MPKVWTETVSVSFTPEQKERVQQVAQRCGMPFSSWARPLLVAAANAFVQREAGEKSFSRLDVLKFLESTKFELETVRREDDEGMLAQVELAFHHAPKLVDLVEYLLALLNVDLNEFDPKIARMVWCKENKETP